MAQLTGKTAIITGATSGIGREAAKVFAAEGAKVVVSGRRAQALETLVEEIKRTGGAAAAVVGDVRQEDVARKLVEVAVEQFGGLDIAFNNAGSSGAMGTVADLTADDWNETLASNLTSAFFAAKYQVPAMIARGRGSLI
ncbi:MAG TPA: SDR family NAD(P)-dependent oxidoreductase, partial [Myxococcaceae bacterium]|nr:SDR family NAD(P)-dependent oxidoreductase [Myxococcaceae bacterium]